MVKISQQFGFSLDHLVETSTAMNKTKWAVFNADKLLPSSPNYIEQYIRKWELVLAILDEMMDVKTAKARCVSNVMPYTFFMPYENLSRFSLYKLAYLTQGVRPGFLLSKMVVTPKLLEIEKAIVHKFRQVPHATIIIDQNIFSYYIADINYFYERKLVSPEEYKLLKKELSKVVDLFEYITGKGTYDTGGGEVTVYLADVILDSAYIHFEYNDKMFCSHRAYFVDSLSYRNAEMCRKQKDWIDSLKRYSTLITQSGESVRFNYFNKQRELIKSLMPEEGPKQ